MTPYTEIARLALAHGAATQPNSPLAIVYRIALHAAGGPMTILDVQEEFEVAQGSARHWRDRDGWAKVGMRTVEGATRPSAEYRREDVVMSAIKAGRV